MADLNEASDLNEALSQYVQEQTPTTPPPFAGVAARARHRSRRRMVTIAAVPVVLVGTILGAQLTSDPTAGRPVAQAPTASQTSDPTSNTVPNPPATPGSSQGSVPLGSMTSCAQQYDLTTLRQVAFAFDGTVSRISATPPPPDDPSGALDPLGEGYYAVTFTVHEWFLAGDQATFTLHMMSTPDVGRVGSTMGTSFGVGTRLLVSGVPRFGGRPLQAPIAWPCGFTRDYDPSTAVAWRQTLGRR